MTIKSEEISIMKDPPKALTVDGHLYQRIHLIRHCDPYAGFSSLLTYALNGVRKALENDWIAVVDYDDQINTHFYDSEFGPNVWEYYFEPVMGLAASDVKRLLEEGELVAEDHIHTYPPDVIWEQHRKEPQRIATFWNDEPPEDPLAWFQLHRKRGRDYVARFLRVKPHILAKVEEFWQAHISSPYVVGAHIRGTDFAYAAPTAPERYFEAIELHLQELSIRDFQVFLATDQSQFVALFESRFPGRVITAACTRSGSDVPAFLFTDVSPYKKGEEVLLDILLLSRCDFLFKGASAVGEYALWFNPELDCVDFALESQYRPLHEVPAYLGLNVAKTSKWKHGLIVSLLRIKQFLLSKAIRLGRLLLPKPLRAWLWENIGYRLYFQATRGQTETGHKTD